MAGYQATYIQIRMITCEIICPNIWFNFAAAFGKPQAVLSEETMAERAAIKTGESVELSSRGGRKSTSGGS